MPEIKNIFTSGKMNKDLDERLIPSTQYRDALNIEVAHSEGSDVGAIENLLGNSKHINSYYNPVTQSHTQYNLGSGTTDDLGITNIGDGKGKVIGVVRYDKTECIYWLVTSDTTDAIIEYDQKTDVVSPVLVDKNGVLNFSKDKLVTGINILDNILFFTDDNSEPKYVDISLFKEASKNSTNGFVNHTEIYGRDFEESDITVIKKSPLIPPTVQTRASKRDGVGVGTSPLSGFYLFYGKSNGDEIALYFNASPDYRIGDTLSVTTNYGDKIYEITAQITGTSGGTSLIYANILSIPEEVPSEPLIWEVILVEDEPMFQYKFPRFAYRWKYNNGQYSAFSPFTKAIFLADNFEYLSSNGYNTGMSNNIRFIEIGGFVNPENATPVDVVEIEILYKESNSNVIYSIDTIPVGTNSIKLESDLIHKIIEGNQLLRPWDNVPRKAKAQEIIANRIVYGNYLQNFNIDQPLSTKFTITSAAHPLIKSPVESLKSLRKYQLGVVWIDKYGRETPVFTTPDSVAIVDGSKSNLVNKISASITSIPPAFAESFKYFIKEISNEYYNLALDRFYFGEDGNVWLSFPSAERNKVDINTYLYLKKAHNGDESVGNPIKYKILDIKNEVPTFIAEIKKSIANADVSGTTIDHPHSGTSGFEFQGPSYTNNPDFYSAFKSRNLLTIKFSGKETKEYEIKSGGPTGNGDKFEVYLTEAFSETFLDTITNGTGFKVYIKEKVVEKKPEFEGRFFVKINQNSDFNKYVVEAFNSVETEYNILLSADIPENIANTGPGDDSSGFGFGDIHATDSAKLQLGPPQAQSTRFGIGWSGYSGGNRISPISPNYSTSPILDSYLPKAGTLIRFVNSLGEESNIYEIKEAEVQYHRRGFIDLLGNVRQLGSNSRKQVICVMTEPFQPDFGTVTGIQIMEAKVSSGNEILSTPNPAVFETEPKDTAALDIYYEASGAYKIYRESEEGYDAPSVARELDWFNCFSFGNGVESDRIRDDFNAPTIGKGVRVSAVLDEPYGEERRESGLIFSQIYNSTSGVNRLNQFIQALPITKDLNPSHGSIQKLHARDTDLIALCEDKCFRILANKDALYNADGNVNITSNNNVLGQAMPYDGEFGISKNPESFASYGFRTFFADKSRGVVLRLSRNGLEEISNQGISNYLADKLANATEIIGSYDDYSGSYNISFADETISYKQGIEGWTTRKSFVPDAGISLNNTYYTFIGGLIWSHDNPIRNNFYGTQYKSSVTFIANGNPSEIKNFKTLNYEGDNGWTTPSINTDQQSGKIDSYIKKEGIYYNFIKGNNKTWDNTLQSGTIDTSEFSVQGIGTLASISGDTAQTEFTLTVSENND